jgi:cytochrome P450/NADPH-cytochrome P450 reductase
MLGNLRDLNPQAPTESLTRLAKQYGPIYKLKVRGRVLVVVSSFKLANELCDQARFDKIVGGGLLKLRALGGNGLFTADTTDPDWSKAHNILLPNFSQRAIQSYHATMLDIAGQLVDKWARLNSDDEIDVARDMTSLTLDTIGTCGFDYRFNSFYRDTSHPFVRAMVDALSTAMAQVWRLPAEHIFRRRQDAAFQRDIEYMNSMVDRIIRDRRHNRDDADKSDLLNSMLEGVDRKTGERLDDLNIRYQVLTFLIGGHETTSGLLSFAINALINHPEVLLRAYAEVDRVFGPDRSRRPTYDQVNQLGYIHQILKETLRLWPTAPAFSLHSHEETVIDGKYLIKPTYQIRILLQLLHRDPSVWGERAEIFDPDNFTSTAERERPPNAWLPFGNGMRACIGRQFAMQEAALVLGMLLHRFELIDHTRYKLKIKETLTLKPEGLRIRVKPRSNHSATAQPVQLGTIISNGLVHDDIMGKTAVPRPRVAGHDTPLLVLYGSNLGTAEEVAGRIAQDGESHGFAVTLAPLDDYVGRLSQRGAVIIVTASYNGLPPDNAAKFCAWLTESSLSADALKDVRYSVFGCGNRDWAATYQATPHLIDKQIEKCGAQRIHPRGEGDARDDFDGQFQTWNRALWDAVGKALQLDLKMSTAATRAPLYTVEMVADDNSVNSIAEALGAKPMRLLVNRELQIKDGPFPSERSTRHLEFALPEGVSYRAGDHLGVVPQNSDDLVRRVARRFGFEGDAYVKLRKTTSRKTALPVEQSISVFTLLGDYLELQDVATRTQIEVLCGHTECPPEKARLAALMAGDTYKAEVLTKHLAVIDLLEQCPACILPFETFLEMMPLLAPRYYSISSSPLTESGRLSLTVAIVEGPARSGRGTYRGVCSNYLRSLEAGNNVRAFVKDTGSAFRPPADPSVPMIMIGPGAGIAPFRGFLQERSAQKASGMTVGPSMLFFGCRRPDQDFIYADELRGFAEQGITELVHAFSRLDPDRKVYVQDCIREHQDTVWKLIEGGSVVYICGDANGMAPGVRQAFAAIHGAKTGVDAPESERWIDQMTADRRYLIDVWSAT